MRLGRGRLRLGRLVSNLFLSFYLGFWKKEKGDGMKGGRRRGVRIASVELMVYIQCCKCMWVVFLGSVSFAPLTFLLVICLFVCSLA